MRFHITWVYDNDTGVGQYKVSVPNYDGGEVVFPDLPEPTCRAGFATQEIIDAADLVTEMKEVKHYFNSTRVMARRGFEF